MYRLLTLFAREDTPAEGAEHHRGLVQRAPLQSVFRQREQCSLEFSVRIVLKIRHLRWRLLLSRAIDSLRKSDVLIGAGGFSFRDNAGRAYSPLFDSCREAFEEHGYSVQMVALRGDARPGMQFAAGNVPNLPSVERGYFVDAGLRLVSNGRVRTRFEERAWSRILDAVQPRVVVANQPSPALCRAGRDRGIEVFDMQHGHIRGDHRAYYNVKKPQRTHPHEWPSAILCWDERTAEIVSRDLGQYTSSHVVGHPWLTRFISPKGGDNVAAAAIARAEAVALSTPLPVVVVTLQWNQGPNGKTGLYGDLLPGPLIDYICRTKSVAWLIRPHPVQDRESRGQIYNRIQDVFGTCETLIRTDASTSRELALPAVLSRAVAHVTVSSSSTLEATWLGVPSWQFSEPHPFYNYPLVQSGADIEALGAWLDNHISAAERPIVGQKSNSSLMADFSADLCRACGLLP